MLCNVSSDHVTYVLTCRRKRRGVGWCVGVIKEANGDRRRTLDGDVVNFFVHYEIDDDTSKHVLTLADYGGERGRGVVGFC